MVSGCPVSEAVDRASRYYEAGTDAILIHSKKSTAAEIEEFCRQWNNTCPVVIVPTKYFRTPTRSFRDCRVSMAIWANHNLRASITAMKQVCQTIFKDESLSGVESEITPVSEIFQLTGEQSFAVETQKYLGSQVK